jgi:pilus biogenesis lipoprotein CpaD
MIDLGLTLGDALSLRRLVFVGAAALALGGCMDITQNPAPNAAQNRNIVREVELRHDVMFNARSTRIDPATRIAIDKFLRENRLAQGDNVIVTARTIGASRTDRRLARVRRARVAAYLRSRGVRAAGAEESVAGLGPSVVTIRASRHTVIAPNCPDWQAATGRWTLNATESRMGCMNASALAAMIANPIELEKGGHLSPADPNLQTLGVRNYRKGKAKTPASSQTK